jgi:hypothetical protein
MTDDELKAIRVDDAASLFVRNLAADRRALLRYVDALRAELAALREAAGKVKCWTCHGSGKITWTSGSIMPLGAAPIPCPDCADLRKILGEKP